ncbi:Alpha/Beta hydrolase protein [Boletus reticuloceps]|uniref:Carboxypeptidase n=1 Tax=Boletus reticuloceps TaxID=495285 RepID=A0A8I2YE96_9AGAM|nr:Alpha/Beta hydrolase protein [Boletus reticuloceps]
MRANYSELQYPCGYAGCQRRDNPLKSSFFDLADISLTESNTFCTAFTISRIPAGSACQAQSEAKPSRTLRPTARSGGGGRSWAVLLPISNNSNKTGQLFFWFFPPGPEASLDDLIFWTNGAPGCSSLEGLLQENGPFSWSYGQAKPTVNENSWTNLSSVLWVEQPVGAGFSQGTPNIENEDQLVGFLQQFLDVFSELKGKKLWLTGESYAGTYIPDPKQDSQFVDIANHIYENPTLLDLSLRGMWIGDRTITFVGDVVQEEIPAVDFVHKYQGLFSFNQTFLDYLDQTATACNYTNYLSTYMTYPPNGLLPLLGDSVEFADRCDVWDDIFYAALIINPAFNIYRIWDTASSEASSINAS